MPRERLNITATDPRVLDALQRIWGFDSLRPLQAEAITAGLSKRDALVVMPTGGGKSLCYQLPPLVTDRTDVVISPLIALMKDQVDGLRQLGYPAAALHSNLTPSERQRLERGIRAGEYRLIFVAPERLVSSWFLETVKRLDIHAIAVDEAHCISQWGHDFRPEYRQLAILRDRFPEASIHAYTATATPRVREDIVEQLRLREPLVLVGTFDRPNLTYRILPQVDLEHQIVEVLHRHAGEAAIVYCLSRRDTESLAQTLQAFGIKAEHYHAGLTPQQRRATQDRFASEQIDVVVATIAFGMGIDRGNVRAVIHACIPKSIENYQQETGRAGRDGLPAECILFYSQADAFRLQRMLRKSADEADDPEAAAANLAVQLELLRKMQNFANTTGCRHKFLSQYFGQDYTADNCNACDACLGEVEGVEDSTVTAQKIISCVARVRERFGVGHLVEVLVGARTQRIEQFGHDKLSTYGLLHDVPRKTIQSYIYQLLDQDLLTRSEEEYPVVMLNDASWEVLRGRRTVRLSRPKRDLVAKVDAVAVAEGVDRGLFEHLREVRRRIAAEQGVPAYVVLHDRTLMDLAAVRPTGHELFKRIHGVGERKRVAYGDRIICEIVEYCRKHHLPTDVPAVGLARSQRSRGIQKPNPARQLAEQLFAESQPIEAVVQRTGRARSTITGYLAEWIAEHSPASIDVWVDPALRQRITSVIQPGDAALKPVFDRLNGEVSYDAIRLVMSHLSAGQPQT